MNRFYAGLAFLALVAGDIALSALVSKGFQFWDNPTQVQDRDEFRARLNVLTAKLNLASLEGGLKGKTEHDLQFKQETLRTCHRELSDLHEQGHYKYLVMNEQHRELGLLAACLELSRVETVEEGVLQDTLGNLTRLLDLIAKGLPLNGEKAREQVVLFQIVMCTMIVLVGIAFLAGLQ